MKKRQLKRELLLLMGLVCTVTTLSIGQGKSIDLEGALSIARENYSGLHRDRLAVDQQNKLAETRLPFQPTQLFLSGEEFGTNNQSGIQYHRSHFGNRVKLLTTRQTNFPWKDWQLTACAKRDFPTP